MAKRKKILKTSKGKPANSSLAEPLPTDSRPWKVLLRIVVPVYVLVQIALPLSYYLRDNPYDERFAWRMFSSVHLYDCEASLEETTTEGETRRVKLDQIIHQAWVNHLQRNRSRVIHRLLERRCDESDVGTATLVNRCRRPDGESIDPLTYEIECEGGEFREPDHAP